MSLSRRRFLGASGAAALLGAAGGMRSMARAAVGPAALPHPSVAPFDHVVVLMMENRSFDHFLGWLPGANGRQAGLRFTNLQGTTYPTYELGADDQGCGYGDPDHSWQGGQVQLNGGRCDGFLRYPTTRRPNDTFNAGYYTAPDLPVVGSLARHYTTLDGYFASIMAETYPNRFYQHAARTDRDTNLAFTDQSTLPTIWDRLAGAGLEGRYYFGDLPFLGLWGSRYVDRWRTIPNFLADCAAGTLPSVAFVDPPFNGLDFNTSVDPAHVLLHPTSAADYIDNGEYDGTSMDFHPHGDIRAGEWFVAQVYNAVRNSPAWDRTLLVINFDEWGGFFDHVPPPLVVDDTVRAAYTRRGAAHPDYRQLGFRVPCIVVSPFSRARVAHGGPYEHTSVLRMIEWRWGLRPLTARDAHARNLAEVLDFSRRRSDRPAIPLPAFPEAVKCGPTSAPPRPPRPVWR